MAFLIGIVFFLAGGLLFIFYLGILIDDADLSFLVQLLVSTLWIGGTFTILTRILMGGYEDNRLRRDLFGLEPGEKLVPRVTDDVLGRKSPVYSKTLKVSFSLEMTKNEDYSVEYSTSNQFVAIRNFSNIVLWRDVGEGSTRQVKLRNLPSGQEFSPEEMTPKQFLGHNYFQIVHNFFGKKEYELKVKVKGASPIMNPVRDFMSHAITTPTAQTFFEIHFPAGTDLRKYELEAFLADIRYERLDRILFCSIVGTMLNITEEGYADRIGALQPGDRIHFYYKYSSEAGSNSGTLSSEEKTSHVESSPISKKK